MLAEISPAVIQVLHGESGFVTLLCRLHLERALCHEKLPLIETIDLRFL
jgi:hypothetical protein